jgi:CheY-like chemotaxis protein
MDLMFPKGVTGYDICQAIRAVPDLAAVPIVAVSAADPSEAIPQTRKLGFAGFISKPINFQTFTRQVASIIAGEAVWDDGSDRRASIA